MAALILVSLPMNAAFATPATIQSISSVSSVDANGNSVFDVSWNFGAGAPPVDFFLVTCYLDLTASANTGNTYPIGGWDYFFEIAEQLSEPVSTNGEAQGSKRIIIDNLYLGIYFFRAFAAQPGLDSTACDSERAEVPTTTFKFSQIPFSVLRPTNAYSTSHVAYTDYMFPGNFGMEPFRAASSHSAPLAHFPISPISRYFLQNGNPRLTTQIDGVPEQVAQNPKPCSRSLLLDEGDASGPPSTPDIAGTRLWTDATHEDGYLALCSWDNFPITNPEALDQSFDGRTVTNQIIAEVPIWFPDPDHGYGLSTNPQQLNPQLVTTSPLTSELTFNFSTGNAVTNNLTLTKLSNTSFEASWNNPEEQAGFALISDAYLSYERLSVAELGFVPKTKDSGPGGQETLILNDLVIETYSAQLYIAGGEWSVFRSDPVIVELSRVTIGFDLADYSTTRSDLASRFGYVGDVVVLPEISLSDRVFTGWSDGSNDPDYQGGDQYRLIGSVTFSAQFRYFDSRITAMTLSGDVFLDYELFPAFDPNVYDYYLNLSQHDFAPFTLSFAVPKSGEIQYHFEPFRSIGPLINEPTETEQTKSFVVTNEDISTFESPRQDAQLAKLTVKAFSDLPQNQGGSSSEYVIHIARAPSLITNYRIDFDLGAEVVGSISSIGDDYLRYVTLPGPGNLEREGFGFAGWVDEDNARYNPGEVILLDRDLLLTPRWAGLDLTYLSIEDSSWENLSPSQRWIKLPLEDRDPNLLSYSLVAPFSYRISLSTLDGELVSRYSNNQELTNQNLNATDENLSTCLTQNNCLSVFTIQIESWATTVSAASTFSFHVMRPTQSGRVCLSVENMETPDSGVEEFNCASDPGWMRAPRLDRQFQLSEGDYHSWRGFRAGDVRVVTGYRFDILDLNSTLYGYGHRIPVFEDTTIQSVWTQDEQARPIGIDLFGELYDFEDCPNPDDDSEYVICMRNATNPQELIYPSMDEEGPVYLLTQEFTETSWSATLSANLEIGYDLYVMGEDGESFDETDDGFNTVNFIGSNYSESYLCPVGNCGAIYSLNLYGNSTFGYNDLNIIIKILRRDSASPNIDYHFSMAGGTGLSTQSFTGQIGWVTPPNVDGVTKSGAVHRGEWTTNRIDGWYGGLLPVWYDGQTFSLDWLPAYEVRFRDHLTDGVIRRVNITHNQPYWSALNLPTASHPLGRALLGWTSISGSVEVTTFSTDLTFSSDVDFYPVWGDIPISPAPSAPNGFQNNTGVTTPSSSPSTSPPATQSPTASGTSTSVSISRVNGMTEVAFALPAKYEGGKATFEVKRWINNRVRYFVISRASVQGPDASGRAVLDFKFKLQLKPTDFIRIKVGKVTVLGKRLR